MLVKSKIWIQGIYNRVKAWEDEMVLMWHHFLNKILSVLAHKQKRKQNLLLVQFMKKLIFLDPKFLGLLNIIVNIKILQIWQYPHPCTKEDECINFHPSTSIQGVGLSSFLPAAGACWCDQPSISRARSPSLAVKHRLAHSSSLRFMWIRS